MKKYIVLFRGINVGGKNLLPMKELVPLLEKDGFEDVSFYIQSGNLVLETLGLPQKRLKLWCLIILAFQLKYLS